MLKNTILFSLVLLSFITAQTLISSYTNGAPAGYTGSPGDGGETCATSTCHTGTAISIDVEGWIETTVPEEGYAPDSVYSISVVATEAGRTKFGFELSPQDLLGNQLGTLIASSQTQLRGGGKYITHKQTSVYGNGTYTWDFEWKAPAAGSGNVNLYAVMNCSNNNGNISGDNVYRTKLILSENTTVSMKEQEIQNAFTVYPNPSTGIIKLNRKAPLGEDTELRVYSFSGELVFHSEITQTVNDQELDLSVLQNGLYILRINENGKEIQKLKISIFK